MASSESTWEVPQPLSTHEVRMDDGSAIVLRRHGNPDGPRLVMSHGNGLAIDLYYPFWSRFTSDFDVIVYDQRNHGWNTVSAMDNHNIPTLVSDHDRVSEAIDGHYGKKAKVGIYHSFSALTTLLSPNRGREFVARVLFDPPLCKPGRSYQDFETAANRLAALARRRTARIKSREDFEELLGIVPTFSRVAPGVIQLFTRTTLRESSDGQGYELRCPREYEAQIVEYAGIYAVLVDFDTLVTPTKVVGADPILPFSYLPTLDLSDIMTVDYDFLPETSHFMQLEEPEQCAEATLEFLESIGFS